MQAFAHPLHPMQPDMRALPRQHTPGASSCLQALCSKPRHPQVPARGKACTGPKGSAHSPPPPVFSRKPCVCGRAAHMCRGFRFVPLPWRKKGTPRKRSCTWRRVQKLPLRSLHLCKPSLLQQEASRVQARLWTTPCHARFWRRPNRRFPFACSHAARVPANFRAANGQAQDPARWRHPHPLHIGNARRRAPPEAPCQTGAY